MDLPLEARGRRGGDTARSCAPHRAGRCGERKGGECEGDAGQAPAALVLSPRGAAFETPRSQRGSRALGHRIPGSLEPGVNAQTRPMSRLSISALAGLDRPEGLGSSQLGWRRQGCQSSLGHDPLVGAAVNFKVGGSSLPRDKPACQSLFSCFSVGCTPQFLPPLPLRSPGSPESFSQQAGSSGLLVPLGGLLWPLPSTFQGTCQGQRLTHRHLLRQL